MTDSARVFAGTFQKNELPSFVSRNRLKKIKPFQLTAQAMNQLATTSSKETRDSRLPCSRQEHKKTKITGAF